MSLHSPTNRPPLKGGPTFRLWGGPLQPAVQNLACGAGFYGRPFKISLVGRPLRPAGQIVGVHEGESLAGNDSSDASATMSFGRQPVAFRRRSSQSRAMPRSRKPIAARTLNAAPSAP